MRTLFFGIGLLLVNILSAQRECKTFEYQQQVIQNDPQLAASRGATENFILQHLSSSNTTTARGGQVMIIKIPVVVHILYHYLAENVSDEMVRSQITALNRDFRKLNSDTTKIPSYFRAVAADCAIEFELAKVAPGGKGTNGIIHKYTPITRWQPDDKIKYSSEMGDDAWDTKSYLNIWVGTIPMVMGYSSFPGDPESKDGIVLSNRVVGITNSGVYNRGRTAVHEVGHWLGLRHLWGDADCGDDGVADTPKQQTFTNGCPSAIRLSCDNAPNGDMYMDYMDFTNDDCLVMFTNGQKQRMRASFQLGGPRYSILFSNGLGIPTIEEISSPEAYPQWLHIQVFPNPATTGLTINLAYDARWIGKELAVIDINGQVQMKRTITSKIQKLDISRLKPGIYFIRAEKEGEKMMQKFIKL